MIGRHVAVRGWHHKFCHLWKFPQIPEHHAVAQSMLPSLCNMLGRKYQGFRPARRQYLSDSEGASTPSESLSADQEDGGLRMIRE